MAKPLFVIGCHFSVPRQVGLEVKKKDSCFYLFDTDGSIAFQIKDEESKCNQHRVLLGSSGNRIANLKQQKWSSHNRWEVYRGNSRDERDLLFSVTKTDEQQSLTPKLYVFLASSGSEVTPDLRIEGSWSARSFAIYRGKFTNILAAELIPNTSVVTVYPCIDWAFILTLIAILYEIFEGVDGSVPGLLDAVGPEVVQGIGTGVVQAIGAEPIPPLPPPPPTVKPLFVIGSHFSVPHQVGLEVKKKDSCFYLFDTDGSIAFQIKDEESKCHQRCVLFDSLGNRIANLKQKILTSHKRWDVYRGNSIDERDLLFSVSKPDEQQSLQPKLYVFLASTRSEVTPDLRIEGSWSARSFAIYRGKFTTILAAQLIPNTSVVTVYPNIDWAFILTLIAILYEIFERVDGSVPGLLDAVGPEVVKGIGTGVVQAIGAEPIPPLPPPPMVKPLFVIGSHFSVPHQVDLEVSYKDSCFYLFDTDGSILFQIRHEESKYHQRRVLFDSLGNRIANLKQKKWSSHNRWEVYRGNSRDEKDLLFSVTKPDEQQYLQTKLYVFLASSRSEGTPDLRVEASWSAKSFAIYRGKFTTILAAQHIPNTSVVTVYPNIDRAFILTLIAIGCEILEGVDSSKGNLLDEVATGIFQGVGSAVGHAIGTSLVHGFMALI